MKLLTLQIRKFKGCLEARIDPNGEDIAIFGDNATGKTTIADAWFWLLFGKDSQNRADFEIKPLDSSGQPVSGIESEVSAVLKVNGDHLELKRVYKEVWTKKRSSAESEFTGHTTDYFINTVPVQKKEYDERIASIANPNEFRLLTDPFYFNTVLKWEDRRKMIISLTGDFSDEDVFELHPELKELRELQGALTFEEFKKKLKNQKTEINSSLQSIPVRIDEAKRVGPAPLKPDGSRTSFENEIKQLEEQKTQVRSGGMAASKRVQIQEIDAEVLKLKNSLGTEEVERQKQINQQILSLSSTLRTKQTTLETRTEQISQARTRIEEIGKKVEAKRNEYKAVNSEEFAFTADTTCTSCGQELPESEVDALRLKAQNAFNQSKATRLEVILSEGRTLNAEIESKEEAITKAGEQVAQLGAEIDDLNEQIKTLESQVQTVEIPDITLDSRFISLQSEKERLNAEILNESQSVEKEVAALDERIGSIRSKIQEFDAYSQHEATLQRVETRVNELVTQKKELGAEWEKVTRAEYLCESFIKAKVRLLTDRINSRFALVRFKLFDTQVNGAIVECCEAEVNGVPFGNLNHGMQLNAGLEIIDVLSKDRGFTPPIFIDNAESVTFIRPTDAQQIRLVVSALDRSLRVESAAQTLVGAL